jgi:hypothetical protein
MVLDFPTFAIISQRKLSFINYLIPGVQATENEQRHQLPTFHKIPYILIINTFRFLLENIQSTMCHCGLITDVGMIARGHHDIG